MGWNTSQARPTMAATGACGQTSIFKSAWVSPFKPVYVKVFRYTEDPYLVSFPAQSCQEGQDQGTKTTSTSKTNNVCKEHGKYGQAQQHESSPHNQVLLQGHETVQALITIFFQYRKPVSHNPHLVFAGEPAKEQTQDQPRYDAAHHLQQTLQYVHPRRACRTNKI